MPSGYEREPDYGGPPASLPRIVIGVIIMMAIATAVAWLMLTAAHAAPIAPERIYVIDGDTIRVDDKRPNWRLVGFNAADYLPHGHCQAEHRAARQAEDLLLDIVAAGHLDLQEVRCACPPGTELTEACNNGRHCGILTSNGVNVGEELIAAGVAAPFLCGATRCPALPHPWCDE